MKELAKLLTVILVISISLPSCHEMAKPNTGYIGYRKDTIDYITIGQYMRDVSRFENEVNATITDSLMALTSRKRFIAKYKNQRAYVSFNSRKASRQVTFSLHRLKNFIADIESSARLQGIDDSKLGITWSFALYDMDSSHIINGNDYRSLHTLYGVPTVKTDTGREIVNLSDWVPLHYYAQKIAEDSSGSPLADDVFPILAPNADAFNLGQLCPPNCDPDPDPLYDAARMAYGKASYTSEY